MLYEIDGVPAFRIDLYDNPVAHKWKALIQDIYVGDGDDIDHKRTFLHLRSKEEIKIILLNSIEKINSFLKTEFIKLPNPLNWDSQEFYNNLHVSFEKLSGEFDNPTKLMKIAPSSVKESIRDLNFCVHALENPRVKNNILNVQWTKTRIQLPRIKLLEQEYELVQFEMKKNEVYLAYNELGKSYVDLWRDNLPIRYNATKNNHYIGADIQISFEDIENIFQDNFIEWCKTQNINFLDKRHGIGVLPIGKIDIISMEHLTKDSKANIINERK